jgi:hypothetical protein
VLPGATEVCNAVDDDCDGTRDDGFECEQNGSGVACTTTCGSTGVGDCDATCMATSCMPPAETCNYADDDCDGFVDQALRTLTERAPYSANSEPARTWTFGGADPLVITVYRGGLITARRFDARGVPTGDEQTFFTIALELELANFIIDFARFGDRLVAILPTSDRMAVEARLFSTTDFSDVGSPLLLGTPSEVQATQIAADAAGSGSILIAYVSMDGTVQLRATDGMLVPRGDAETVTTDTFPAIALEGREGSLDWWLAYTRQVGTEFHTFVQKVRPIGTLVGPAIDTASGARDALLPELAIADDGTIAILEARRDASSRYTLGFQVRRGDGTLVSDAELLGEWGFCLYFTFPYCRPASITWTGVDWLVTRVAAGSGTQDTRLQVVSADGAVVTDDRFIVSSMDQLRMSSAARLESGAVLVTVPTPAQPLHALWGCN